MFKSLHDDIVCWDCMGQLAKVAMVAALEREVRPLIRRWRRVEREHDGRQFEFFEFDDAVLVCGGIGAEAARRATEAVIGLYQPELIQSVGFAGGLDPALKVGAIVFPKRVVDARDGSRVETVSGSGTLISSSMTAGAEQKRKLAESYSAQAVDMEAAAVARGAQARNICFVAVKAISDESDFAMPPMDRFVDREGKFRSGRFVIFAMFRPWLWRRVIQLAANSAKASRALCVVLERNLNNAKKPDMSASELHPISKALN